jgi:hypothetical protein
VTWTVEEVGDVVPEIAKDEIGRVETVDEFAESDPLNVLTT